MSATIFESKYVHDPLEDDCSTSPGSSDTEVATTSGDDEPSTNFTTSPSLCAATSTAQPKKTFDTKGFAEWACLIFGTLLKFCICFRTFLFGATSKTQLKKTTSCALPQTSQTAKGGWACSGKASKPAASYRRSCVPPPGLSINPGSRDKFQNQSSLQHIGAPPGLEAFSAPPGLPHPQRKPKVSAQTPREFDQATYRKELSDVLRDLATGGDVATSVQRIRVQNVPQERQAAEFSDILARAAEENRGVVRRLSFAFLVGLAAGEPSSAFDRQECTRGLEYFFLEVFDDLAAEVPRLRSKIANELVPTLRTAFSEEQLKTLIPPDCRAVRC